VRRKGRSEEECREASALANREQGGFQDIEMDCRDDVCNDSEDHMGLLK
jgi:hypothetical protein